MEQKNNHIPNNTLLSVILPYEAVIKQFKKRSGVISGKDLGWKGSKGYSLFNDTPKDFGSATGTTGWCVSASEALLNDTIFQTNLVYRGAKAKLISIDIKEQYYGNCFNGSQNKWHTAILVEDSGFNFVIDITCRQFGNDFLEKDIWDFNTWQAKLRSPFCKHYITDFNNNIQNINPITSETYRNDLNIAITKNNLKDITNITDSEREQISDFMFNKISEINKNLLLNNISKFDYKYILEITKILQNLPFNSIKEGYSVLSFESKLAAKNWLEIFISNDCKLPMYLTVSDTVKESCLLNYVDFDELNKSNSLSVEKDKTYIVFEFSGLFGINTTWFNNSSILLPYGIELYVLKNNIFNSGMIIGGKDAGNLGVAINENPELKTTNTIIVRVENMN